MLYTCCDNLCAKLHFEWCFLYSKHKHVTANADIYFPKKITTREAEQLGSFAAPVEHSLLCIHVESTIDSKGNNMLSKYIVLTANT